MTDAEFNEWFKAQSRDIQIRISARYSKGYSEGKTDGLKGAENEIKLNKILKALCFVALPAGVFLQHLIQIIR